MNTRKLLLPILAALFGFALTAFGQTATTQATVAKVTGAATVTLPGGSATALTAGMAVPQGATIKTAADGQVLLQAHTGTVATIAANTTVSVDELSVTTSGGKVTEEVTTFNLKSGNLISALDPAKRSVNNYKVKTPKGVAAARGTTFSVKINGNTYTVTTTSGGVSFTGPSGNTFTVGAGQTTDGQGSAPTSIADMPAGAEKDAAVAEMTNVLAAVAVAASAGVVPASELQTAVQAAVEAVPASAAAMVQTVATVAPAQAETVRQAVSNSNVSESVKTEASSAVNTGVQQSTTTTTTTTTTSSETNAQSGETTTTTTTQVQVTTPQPIEISVISRSE